MNRPSNRPVPRPIRGVTAVLIVLHVVALLAGLYGAKLRYHAERSNLRVEMGVEWTEVATLASMSNMPPSAVLSRFYDNGVRSLIIQEDTVASLEAVSALRIAQVPLNEGGVYTSVTVSTEAALNRVRQSLISRGIVPIEQSRDTVRNRPAPNSTVFQFSPLVGPPNFYVSIPYSQLRSLGVGLSPDAVQAAKDTKLRIAGRVSNFPGVKIETAGNVLRDLKGQGASLVIFSGEDALGYRGLEKEVAEYLRDPKDPQADPAKALDLEFGEVEFSKQRGDEKFAAALHGDIIRVHSIQTAEIAQMEQIEVIDRFVRAARERNLRYLYIRLFTQAGPDPVGENAEMLGKISKEIQQGPAWKSGGYEMGAAHKYAETGAGNLIFLLCAAGTAAGIVWLVSSIAPISDSAKWGLLIASLIVYCFEASRGESGRKIVALLTGISYPTIACLAAYPKSSQVVSRASAFLLALKRLAVSSLITGIGIILAVGLLSTRPFMVAANVFLGVKAQHILPLLIVAAVAVIGGLATPKENFAAYRQRISERLRTLRDEPLNLGLVVLSVVSLGLVIFIIMRTGNDSGGASGLEMRFRSILEKIFPARPRSKEFLLGHPAFLLGIALTLRGRPKLGIFLFVAGSIGQASLLDTFCHIHMPLTLSIWRNVTGLILGAIVAGLAFAPIDRILPSEQNGSETQSVKSRERAVGKRS